MIWTLRQLLLGTHIFSAILWVGGVLFIGWGVFPAVRFFTYENQRKFFHDLMQWTHWLFTGLGSVVILSGILLGTIIGPINSWEDVLHTTYGHIWFTALVIGTFTLLWGIVVGYQYSMAVFKNHVIWERAENGQKKELFKALTKLVALESVEGIGFVTLIYLMVII